MKNQPAQSPFAPFKHRVYAVLWGATLISNIGTWMFNVTSGWLMAAFSPSPVMVSLVQAATSLPIFLFALPAGALGDIFDRRRVLLITQTLLAATFFVFAVLLEAGAAHTNLLLLFTFLAGIGAAFSMPAWQAIVPRLVPREALASAIAFNGVSVNIARAIGPALGGFILTGFGATVTVGLDAASYLAVVAALLWWRTGIVSQDELPREHVGEAIRAGLRFALRSRPLQYTIYRALAFFLFASAYWALLPLVAKDLFRGGAGLYGILLTSLGSGALAGAFVLPALKRRLDPDFMVMLGTALTALALLLFAHGGGEAAGVAAGFIAGTAWIMTVSSFSVSAQLALPDWVRARGLAIFQMMFFGAMTLGSVLWGKLTGSYGLPFALTAAAIGALVCIPLTWRFKLNLGASDDYMPSHHWAKPIVLGPDSYEQGPVLVMVEYRITEADWNAFIALMGSWRQIRRRDGALEWGFFQDIEDRERFIESFKVESWIAHLRQHRRVSHADKALQDQMRALHRGPAPPKVTHAITPRPGRALPSQGDHHH